MFGCESCAAVSASRRKRSRVSGRKARSGGRTLIATVRRRRRSVARYTTPMAPRPISSPTSYCVPIATMTRSLSRSLMPSAAARARAYSGAGLIRSVHDGVDLLAKLARLFGHRRQMIRRDAAGAQAHQVEAHVLERERAPLELGLRRLALLGETEQRTPLALQQRQASDAILAAHPVERVR